MAIRTDASGEQVSRLTSLPGITSFTMMGWFQIVTDRNVFTAFMCYGASGNGFLYETQTQSDGTSLAGWNGITTFNGSALSVGTWYHLAMTVAGTGAGQFLIYLNGVLDITADGNVTNPNEKIYYGNSDSNEWLNGKFAAGKIYSAVLTANEINQEMRQYLPVRTANLNTFCPFLTIEGGSSTVDYSGNTFDMTVTGGSLEDGPPIPWKTGQAKFFPVLSSTFNENGIGGVKANYRAFVEGGAQLGKPTSDISLGNWTASPLWDKLDDLHPDI